MQVLGDRAVIGHEPDVQACQDPGEFFPRAPGQYVLVGQSQPLPGVKGKKLPFRAAGERLPDLSKGSEILPVRPPK